jgi:hypothetical protein
MCNDERPSSREIPSEVAVWEFLPQRKLMSLRSRLAMRRRVIRPIENVIDWAFPANELTRLANRYGTDKGNRAFGRHHYTRIYDQLFAHLRDQPITLLEIGLQHPRDKRDAASPSLRMWRDYFPCARLIGFDKNLPGLARKSTFIATEAVEPIIGQIAESQETTCELNIWTSLALS